MRFFARVVVAALSGAVIALLVTAFFLYTLFVAGGYTLEALVELPLWAFGLIGGSGAMVALAVALLAGRFPLPWWVGPAGVGGLAGVAVVVVSTLFAGSALGGPSSKEQAPYLHVGLVYGVPTGLAAGAVAGLIAAKRRGPRNGKGNP